MSLTKNKEIVRSWFEEAWQQNDLDKAVDEYFHPAYVAHALDGEPTPGLEKVKQSVNGARAAFSDIRIEVQDQVAEGDKVASRLILTGTHDGEFIGFAATGKRIVRYGLVIFRLRDDKIVESWRFWDEKFLEQLGMVSVQRSKAP